MGVGTVNNGATNRFLDDVVGLRFLYGSPYSSRDSIPPTDEEKARGEPGLGERVYGRTGRHDMDWAPDYPWPGDYFQKRKLSWKPYSGNSWTLNDCTEVKEVRR